MTSATKERGLRPPIALRRRSKDIAEASSPDRTAPEIAGGCATEGTALRPRTDTGDRGLPRPGGLRDSDPSGHVMASLLEELPEATLLLDLERRIVATNERFRTVFAEGRDVRGENCFAILHPCGGCSERAAGTCPIERCLATAGRVRTIHVHAGTEGDLLTGVEVRPLPDSSGRACGFQEILRPLPYASPRASSGLLVGRSPAFLRTLEELERVAPRMEPVLILGESGTGKERFARALHQISPRGSGDFVPIDGPALQGTRFERELCGRLGSTGTHGGILATADGGTLFLREIDALRAAAQVKLLRLLEGGGVPQDGAAAACRSDFRLLSSSCRDLGELLREGALRLDLANRIGALSLRLPPLRERLEDLPILVESMLLRIDPPVRHRQVHPEALEVLCGYGFPGNLRELFSILERASVLAGEGVILPNHLPLELRHPEPPGPRDPGRPGMDRGPAVH